MANATTRRTEPSVGVDPSDVQALEDRLDMAIQQGDAQGLDVVGYGEVSVALRLRRSDGDYVCKRLVPFSSRGEAQRNADLIAEYVEALRRCGIDVVPTETVLLERPAGHVVYCVQPMLPPATLGPEVLRGLDADQAEPHVARIFEKIRASVSPSLAPDGQLSNWAIDGERLLYLDVGTPFMRGPDGDERFDFTRQTRALPQPIRTIVNRFLLKGILDNYHSIRGQALDFLGNLIKEGLTPLVPPLVPVANRVLALSPPITEPEVRSHYASDARSYAMIQSARRADRWFHRHVLRRSYPYLLPPRIDRFG